MYIYIYIYNPPLNKMPPPYKNPPLGTNLLATINLDGGTITSLIITPPRRQILLLSI